MEQLLVAVTKSCESVAILRFWRKRIWAARTFMREEVRI
jgi:hypothetical protein